MSSQSQLPFEVASPFKVPISPSPYKSTPVAKLNISKRPSVSPSLSGSITKKVKLLTLADLDERCDHFNPIIPPQQPPKEWSKMTLKDIEVGKPLGEGLFGHVYLGRMKSSKIPVALKVIFAKEIEMSHQERSIIRETEIHAGLDHENIIRMYGYFRDGEKIVYVLEYAAGGELYDELQRQPGHRFSNEKAATYIYQVSLALQYLHSKCITHRDIKPENLLLGDFGQVKMADFGWSIQVKSTDDLQKSIVGTMDYLCPEMVKQAPSYDEKVDIWCVGILLYEFLTGTAPFTSNTEAETKEKISSGVFQIPDFVNPEAQDLIRKILVQEPEERISLTGIQNHPWIQKYKLEERKLLPMFNEFAHLLPEVEKRNESFLQRPSQSFIFTNSNNEILLDETHLLNQPSMNIAPTDLNNESMDETHLPNDANNESSSDMFDATDSNNESMDETHLPDESCADISPISDSDDSNNVTPDKTKFLNESSVDFNQSIL